MALSLSAQRSANLLSRRVPRLQACDRLLRSAPQCQLVPRRTFLSWFKSKPAAKLNAAKRPEPILTEDNLFHAFSKSPFPAIRARGEAIQKLAPCPVCAAEHRDHAHAHAQPKAVRFECPNCGWPTHCSEEHWKADEEHQKYCGRLKEVNEDEHDLRSGRRLREFELPGTPVDFKNLLTPTNYVCAGPQDTEAAISFSNWDMFWYTRGYPSMDTERSRRHASKLLTYPITIGSVLHQYSYLMMSNQRLTPEGARSLAGEQTPKTRAADIDRVFQHSV